MSGSPVVSRCQYVAAVLAFAIVLLSGCSGSNSAKSSGTSESGGNSAAGDTSAATIGGTSMQIGGNGTAGNGGSVGTIPASEGAAGGMSVGTGGVATSGGAAGSSVTGTSTFGTGGNTKVVGGGSSVSDSGMATTTGGTAGSSVTGTGGANAVIATPSSGCDTAASPASGRFSIDVSGATREYIIKIPDGYDPHQPYRLIFAFHGGQYSADTVANGGPPGSGPYYGIESQSKGSAIFVAPQALDTSWTNQNGRDLDYVNAMIVRFEAELCIDKSRIFSTGFSMGAMMTIAIGCAQADVFRAIAPMSGRIQGTCTGSHPIAYWASHGANDTTIPIADGETARSAFMTRNHCGTQTIAGNPAGCVVYQGCDSGYPTSWCVFDGVHEPPPYAGEAIWAFLAQF